MIVGTASGSSTLRMTWSPRHPHASRRLDGVPVHLAHPHICVDEDRWDAQDREGEVMLTQPHPEESRHEGDQRQLGNCPAGVANGDRDGLTLPPMPEPDSGRHRDAIATPRARKVT